MNVDRPARRLVLPWQNRKAVLPRDDETEVSRRVPFLGFLPLGVKNHFIAMMGEFVGTFLFLLFAFGGTNVVNTAPIQGQPTDLAANPAKLLYIALCFGFSLAVNAWVFFRISGGLFNPAVTVGMMLVGAVEYLRGALVIVAQILGGIAAAGMMEAISPGPLAVRVSLSGGTTVVQGLFIEMFLTAQLVFTIFMLAAEKHRATFIAPVGIGLSLFIGELWGVYYTGGALNPARAFGPCVVVHNFYTYHWIYWVGPILGSLLASAFYMFIKALEYETVNPDQDEDKEEGDHFNPATQMEKPVPVYTPDQYASPGADPVVNGTHVSGNGTHASMFTPILPEAASSSASNPSHLATPGTTQVSAGNPNSTGAGLVGTTHDRATFDKGPESGRTLT